MTDTHPDTRPDTRPDTHPDTHPDTRPDTHPDHRDDSPPIRDDDGFSAGDSLMRMALLLGGLGVAVVLLGGPVRDAVTPDVRPALQGALPAHRLALEPAGRVGRVPASHPAVQPHFRPGLARLAPSLDEMLLGASRSRRRNLTSPGGEAVAP